ncbi:unnamed protein product [Vitrella brassicaformis CCMP3155]|uniref:Uncharacterized protein n=1 Tax=Vitrella brassicaformis (strain CCMP3155) TaxID=1169540 RepID=A0A0G4GV66_VITBC|nr:unnamed protein product [Vitrella brassicaformis CCMP3155]|eukprot:CEM34788.1 unnamed protein product [Vitrella brassicaformis CCMP3155]
MPPIRRVNKRGPMRKRETRWYWPSRPIWHMVELGEGKLQFWEQCCGCVPCGKATTIDLVYPTIRVAVRPRFKNLTNALVVWHDNTGLGHTIDFHKCSHETIIDGFDAATGAKAAFECHSSAELGVWYDAVMNEVANAICTNGTAGQQTGGQPAAMEGPMLTSAPASQPATLPPTTTAVEPEPAAAAAELPTHTADTDQAAQQPTVHHALSEADHPVEETPSVADSAAKAASVMAGVYFPHIVGFRSMGTSESFQKRAGSVIYGRTSVESDEPTAGKGGSGAAAPAAAAAAASSGSAGAGEGEGEEGEAAGEWTVWDDDR